MLDVEAELARATAELGIIPQASAEAIAGCCDAGRFDISEIGRAAADSATPVLPLVEALRAAVPATAAKDVHRGATSQDVLDTAAMLVAARARTAILADVAVVAAACARLADEHRETAMIGRTLLQPAVPITFGLKAAVWLSGLDAARADLAAVPLVAQLGGAAGTLVGFEGRGTEVAARLAERLGLQEAVVPWHANRVPTARLGAALAVTAGALGKPARDVLLLAQGEVGEVREAGVGRGRSTSMPHKRNPVSAVAVLACAERVPALACTLAAGMAGEHERAAGRWQAEWETLAGALRLTGAAGAWCRDMLERLEVDPARMRVNLASAEASSAGDVDLGEAVRLVDRALAVHARHGG